MKKIGVGLLFAVVALLFAACSVAPIFNFEGDLETAREVPDLVVPAPNAMGEVTAVLNQAETQLTVSGTFSGLTGPAQAAHVHLGEEGIAGGVVCTLSITNAASGTVSGTCPVMVDEQNPVDSGTINLEGLRGGDYYVNVHTEANGSGEIRAQLEAAAGDATE